MFVHHGATVPHCTPAQVMNSNSNNNNDNNNNENNNNDDNTMISVMIFNGNDKKKISLHMYILTNS